MLQSHGVGCDGEMLVCSSVQLTSIGSGARQPLIEYEGTALPDKWLSNSSKDAQPKWQGTQQSHRWTQKLTTGACNAAKLYSDVTPPFTSPAVISAITSVDTV